jgi:predicted MFS family arabinose efflux permease
MSSLAALNAVNFFMADVRDGLGPFLGVFLQQKGWSPAEIGLVMTVGGYAGMAATTPLGTSVDATRAKRALMVASALAIIVASMAIFIVPTFSVVATAQGVMTMQAVGAASSPALAGLVAQQFGYSAAFLALGGIAAVALALWLIATPLVAAACGNGTAAHDNVAAQASG